jgi:hypothetical protein
MVVYSLSNYIRKRLKAINCRARFPLRSKDAEFPTYRIIFMTKEKLLKTISLVDKYDAAYNADIADLLIEYINDDEITEAYEKF